TLGIEPQLLDVRKPEDLGGAFETAITQRADALVVGINVLTQANRRPIADLATKHRLPAIYASREFVDAGGLVALGVSYPDLYRRAATYVDKIGARQPMSIASSRARSRASFPCRPRSSSSWSSTSRPPRRLASTCPGFSSSAPTR